MITTAEETTENPKKGARRRAQSANVAPKKAKSGKPATSATKAPKRAKTADGARDGSKAAKVLELLKQEGGVTLKSLMKATGWQAHSVVIPAGIQSELIVRYDVRTLLCFS